MKNAHTLDLLSLVRVVILFTDTNGRTVLDVRSEILRGDCRSRGGRRVPLFGRFKEESESIYSPV